MTRLQKGPGTAELEREYVYAEPPISITDLAEKYGLARSNVAAKAAGDPKRGIKSWYDKREEFRQKVKDSVSEAMAEKWADMQVAVYERLMQVGMKHLDLHEQALEDGKIKSTTRDMIAVASMMRTLLDDMAKKPTDQDPRLVNPDGDEFDGTAEQARDVIEYVRRLQAGGDDGAPAEPGPAEPDAPQGAADTRQN